MAEVADMKNVQTGETLTYGGGYIQFNVKGVGTVDVTHNGCHTGEQLVGTSDGVIWTDRWKPGVLGFTVAGSTLEII